MKPTIRCLILCLFISIGSFSQQSSKTNSLLWRITGHGLKKPSYVYGTMHLTDKRIFNFSDSLYYSLETTDGYAAELDMGDMMPEMVSEMLVDKDGLVKDIVRPEWLNPYKKRLEKTLNKKLDEITVGDVDNAESKITQKLLREGEMSSIVDMYLYDIAKRQGKWVGGIEDYEDQRKDINSEEEVMSSIYSLFTDRAAMNKQLEWMIRVYTKQQLDSIDLTNQLWKGAETDVLIRRNIKMARRIDSIMQIRTCLFAVGAAHLPGDSGLVTLLRKKGFTVEPVLSNKKIEPGKYKYKAVEVPWVKAGIRDSLYTLLMPGKSEDLDFDKEGDVPAAQAFFDLTRMNFFFSFAMERPTTAKVHPDTLYNGMARNFAKNGKIISSKVVEINGMRGKEFVIKGDEGDMRLQAFLPTSMLVLNAIVAMKYDSLFGADANRYFNSFVYNHKVAPQIDVTPVVWKNYSFPRHAFSIKFPAAFKAHAKQLNADSSWTNYIYSTNKAETPSCYIIAMEANKGFYSNSDSAYFELLRDNVLANLKIDTIISGVHSTFNGYPAYDFSAIGGTEEIPLQFQAKVINRGSRRYYFYAVYSEEGNFRAMADTFLSSFSFMPIQTGKWSYHATPTNDLSFWSPAPVTFQTGEDSTDNSTGYMIYDSLSPVSMIIERQHLSQYTWWSSDSSFFKQQANSYSQKSGDSLVEFKYRMNGKNPEADFTVAGFDNHNLKRVHQFINGDTLYSAFAFLPKELAETPDYKRLFNDIKITNQKPSGDFLVNKTNKILDALVNGDSTAFAEASSAVDDASFTATDLPQLHQALLKPYRDYDEFSYYNVHRRLIDRIVELNDKSSFAFIKNNYPLLKDSLQKLQYPFLYFLLSLKTKESFELFRQIVTTKLPVEGDPESLRFELRDSLELTKQIFPALLPLSADTSFIKVLPYVSNYLLDSGLIAVKDFEPYKKNFYAFAERTIKKLKTDDAEYDRSATELIALFARFKEPAAYKMLQQFATVNDVYTKKQAVMTLIKEKQKVDPLQVEKIAKDNYYRISLYEELKEAKQEKLFPAKYYTQKYFAQSEVCQLASDDYDADSVVFIAEKSATFMGKKEKFYLFKVVYNYEEGETESYLGIAGPYPTTAGKILTESKASGLYTEEQYDPKRLTEFLKAHLTSLEEYYASEEKED